MMDARVEAIRCHPKVGRGSCTTIDETYDDADLIRELDEDRVITPEGAVAWAMALEGLRIENATNFRWGSDDDPELKRLKEWES